MTSNNPCGCNDIPCVESPICDCPIQNLKTKCIVYSGITLPCSQIPNGLNFDEFILQLDAYICDAIAQVNTSINLISVGDGFNVYKGIDNLGRREIKSIKKVGNLITLSNNTNDITFSIDETELTKFIQANQKTYEVANVGTGATMFKDETTVGNVNTFNFKSVIIDPQNGSGQSTIRDVQQNTNDLTIRTKKIKSSTLRVTATDTEVSIEQPETATVSALYVNSLYIPSEEEFLAGNTRGLGSLAQPITNTISAYVAGVPTITPNTAIQNAKEAYIGTGTALAPEKLGQKIVIQDNNSVYTFAGDFNAQNIDVELQGNVLSTTTGYLVNMDDNTKFNSSTSKATITVNADKFLQIQGEGFNNSGNTIATNTFITRRTVFLKGEGQIFSDTNDITKYLINADFINAGNNNDGNLCFDTSCKIRADFQGIYRVGGNARIDNFGTYQSGTIVNQVNLALKAFHQTGGTVRKFKGSNIDISGATVNPRTSAITFTPTAGFTPFYISQNAGYIGTMVNLFEKTNNSNTFVEVTNSISYYGTNIANTFKSTNLWTNVRFTENNFGSGLIDSNQVDLTNGNLFSSINTIGTNLSEILVKYGSRTLAEAVLPIGSKFINTNSNNADTNTWRIDITIQ